MPDQPPASSFRVALTGDFYKDQQPVYPDFDLSPLRGDPNIELSTFDEHQGEVAPEQLANVNGVIVLSPRVTRRSLEQSQGLLVISRFGVGYDSVDIAACTEHSVAVCITKGAVDRPVAEATVGWMFALSYRMQAKDRLFRAALWDRRGEIMGGGLQGKTVGVVGFGGIGRTVVQMLRGFEMNRPLVYDPLVASEDVRQLGGEPATLERLMVESDFVTVHCPLNDQTRDLISESELQWMKPTAFILNTARGGIINEDALYQSLATNRIAGAALDCFADEPVTEPHRFAQMDNVILASHNIAWTRELFRDIGIAAARNVIELAHGAGPSPNIVNPEVFERAAFQEKWESLRVGQNG